MPNTANKKNGKSSAKKAEKSSGVKNSKKMIVFPKGTAAKSKVPAKKIATKSVKAVSKKVDKKLVPAKKATPKKIEVKSVKTLSKKADKKLVPAKKATPKKIEAKSVNIEKAVLPKTGKTFKRDEILKKLRLSKTDQNFFRGLLLHARAQFGQQVKFHSEDALSTHKDSAGERAGMATHMADLGTDNYRHDYELQLMSEEVDVLEMIDEALQRLEDSEYGICLDCGEQIPRKRLEAKPYARYCTKCKSQREQMDENVHRR